MPFDGDFTQRIDCSDTTVRSNLLLCRLLPLGLTYDVSEVDANGRNGKNGDAIKILYSTKSSDAIIYVTIVVLVYIAIFLILVFTSYRKNVVRNRDRRSRSRQPKIESVVECDRQTGRVRCQTDETRFDADCV